MKKKNEMKTFNNVNKHVLCIHVSGYFFEGIIFVFFLAFL